MPYKNPEDKRKWRKRNKKKQIEYKERWKIKYGKVPKKPTADELQKREEKKQIEATRASMKLAREEYLDGIFKNCGECYCNMCQARKPRDQFFRESSRFNGVEKRCKDCYRLMRKKPSNYHTRESWARRIAWRSKKREKKLTGGNHHNLSPEDFLAILDNFNHKCFKCGSTEKLTFDHNHPMRYGGVHSYQNTVILCSSCNSSKQERSSIEFYSKDELARLVKMLGIQI